MGVVAYSHCCRATRRERHSHFTLRVTHSPAGDWCHECGPDQSRYQEPTAPWYHSYKSPVERSAVRVSVARQHESVALALALQLRVTHHLPGIGAVSAVLNLDKSIHQESTDRTMAPHLQIPGGEKCGASVYGRQHGSGVATASTNIATSHSTTTTTTTPHHTTPTTSTIPPYPSISPTNLLGTRR